MKITIKFLTPELVPLLIKIVELSGKVVKKLINDVCGTVEQWNKENKENKETNQSRFHQFVLNPPGNFFSVETFRKA